MGLISRSRFRDAVLACIAAHGFTDFLSLDGEGLALYAVSFVALRWLSRDARWIPFLIASALHFSRDMRDLEIEERWAAILVIFTALLHCVKQTCVAVWLMPFALSFAVFIKRIWIVLLLPRSPILVFVLTLLCTWL